jgi:hypothetical protein
MLDTAVSRPVLLYRSSDLAFLSAQPLHASQAFAKLVFSDLRCLCVWYGLAKRGLQAVLCALGVIDRVTSIGVSEIGGGAIDVVPRASWDMGT